MGNQFLLVFDYFFIKKIWNFFYFFDGMGGGNLYSSDSRELEKIAFILKSFSYFGKIRNSPRYNVTRKRRTKFHVAMMIKNYFSAGATATAQIFLSPKMCKIAFFLNRFMNFQKIQNTPRDIAARKVCTTFHVATIIRKNLKIGGTVFAPRANFFKSQNV